ncbi:unnamed protein product [Symbiodinium pilosum]|uniref:Uncharacterized protein n=1 Tax=Symbiodinium pilosum TaxID=2952 RepID=A0A812KPC7_SYMPI|nr:unnamed protein product [Symbiodinium pilosum]
MAVCGDIAPFRHPTRKESLRLEELSFKPQIPVALMVSGEWHGYPLIMRNTRKVRRAAGTQCLAAVHIPGSVHTWISETQLLLPAKLLRLAGMMGAGDYEGNRQATVKVLSVLFENLRKPSTQADVQKVLEHMANEDPQNCELLADENALAEELQAA